MFKFYNQLFKWLVGTNKKKTNTNTYVRLVAVATIYFIIVVFICHLYHNHRIPSFKTNFLFLSRKR